MTQFDVVVVGAGAAGMMCAIEAGKRGRSVLVLDHAKAPGEKIRISGGGRCNFTNLNASPAEFLSANPRFCISALRRYTPRDVSLAEEVARRTALALDNNRLLAEITATKVEAEAANAAKDRFLAVLSHELRTPLTPVLLAVDDLLHDPTLPPPAHEVMETDAVQVLKNGVALGTRTWHAFLAELGWGVGDFDRVICHQVGSANRAAILEAFGVADDKDFSTFPYLGNIGTVSVPITAAIAAERDVIVPGDRVGLLGIGSGLNCLMLGLEW